MDANAYFVIRGTGLSKLTAANFVHSKGKQGTYTATSDTSATLSFDGDQLMDEGAQTLSVVVAGETLFTLNVTSNGNYEY